MASEYHFVASLEELLPVVPSDSIISRTVPCGEGAKATLFGFALGQELSEHTASQPAILNFLSGEFTLTLGAETFQAKPGAWAYMPAGLGHSVRAATAGSFLLLLLS